jgi:para-aminobenzoate synthetase component 1
MVDFEHKMNELGSRKIPFLFILDFDLENPVVIPLAEINNSEILYDVNGKSNVKTDTVHSSGEPFRKIMPVKKEVYCKAFKKIQEGISHGDSFLTNLTMPAKVETDLSLKDIFKISRAKYKLYFKDLFVVFSPEPFIRTENGIIRSFPMKGTMDASLPEAEVRLLNSVKELAEHYTIVDLIRNDLNMVAEKVKVSRFRYVEKIKTHYGELLQMSSEITGELPENHHGSLGTILKKLLPAGSVSGAPKKKTVGMIHHAEPYKRGYYTGVFGIFDGENIDSGVMIRYIEKSDNGFVYKSGGGITANSDCEEEYEEIIRKIYVPTA